MKPQIPNATSKLEGTSPLCLQEHPDERLFLEVVLRNGAVHGFPFSHLLSYLCEPNPARDRSDEAAPERLCLWFATHDVVIFGRSLRQIREMIRSGRSITILVAEPRYSQLRPTECFVEEISVRSAEGSMPA